ncbi:hypothetical protein DUNSADRAFT_4274 [Dunaliella salina]|uniref:Uncharacterized protein n=1 Tax=Dunaliella salina TaxID=3046 RepID=A0ABQ7GS74_DUNSA|nr:hypothetical protein DUNSADRAFT_4274 [Dunaliella salina]|eukprot:KAF5837472.1 hypothetical protein DUNSADRAFT_4274 [Dunaliella salina]
MPPDPQHPQYLHTLHVNIPASTEEGGRAELVELRAYVRKGGKLKYVQDGLRWKTSYAEGGDGPPTGIVSL